MNFLNKCLIACAAISASVSVANAGVIIGGTRVVYDGNRKEASVDINNPDKTPYLIQSWVETLNGGVEKAPFIITPPLYRLDGGQQNVERVVLVGNLSQDKESLYWLNIKAIPSSPKKDNTLQIAIKTRIKLIYRPAGLKQQQPQELSNQLTWRRNGNKLQVTNPTKYVINFNEIRLGGKRIENVSYVLPGESMDFSLPAGANATSINFKVINDYGAVSEELNAKFL